MASHADDERYFYGETIGRTIEVAAAAGAATSLAEVLELGRYSLRCLAFGGGTALWVAQGAFGGATPVVAAAAPPAMRFTAHTDTGWLNMPLLTFIAKPGLDGLSFFSVGGIATVQLTKVSRGKA